MPILYYEREEINSEIPKFLKRVDTLVDIGCGIRPFLNGNCKTRICVEPWKEYIDILNHCHPKDASYVFLQMDALTAVKTFPDNSVDSVCMIDLIEHLKKDEGIELLKQADRISRKQIVVFTPLGFMPNHSEESDAWGLGGTHMQEHKSGWNPEDFDKTWCLYVCESYHLKSQHHTEIDRDYGCLWAIKNKNVNINALNNTPEFLKDISKQFVNNSNRKIKLYNIKTYTYFIFGGLKRLFRKLKGNK